MGKTGVGSSGTCHGTDPAPLTNQLDTYMDLAIQGPFGLSRSEPVIPLPALPNKSARHSSTLGYQEEKC